MKLESSKNKVHLNSLKYLLISFYIVDVFLIDKIQNS